jgi:hypothetical protein
VIDNAGSVLHGPELLFASTGTVRVESGSAVETRGTVAGSSGDLRMRPVYDKAIDNNGTPENADDTGRSTARSTGACCCGSHRASKSTSCAI